KKKRTRDMDIWRKMKNLKEILSEDSTSEGFMNSIDNSDAVLSEESKRVVRQTQKQRPGFFWTLARLTFETFNDTRSAIQQIGRLINENLAPEATTSVTIRPVTSGSLVSNESTTAASTTESTMPANGTTAATTTEPYRLSRTQLQTLVRRNFRGLVRLFNIEWADALNQSDITVREFRKDLGKAVGTYLQDNPDAY
ncbi:uncharacterized protein, partial [Prorops nasuta]|uniref:uncharacterized protein n=1 Tax=Prorops nasuta TaxID=863751 RepID=UPI0034CD64F9